MKHFEDLLTNDFKLALRVLDANSVPPGKKAKLSSFACRDF